VRQLEVILGKYGVACIQREGSDPMKSIIANDMLFKHQVRHIRLLPPVPSSVEVLVPPALTSRYLANTQNNIHIVPTWIPNDVSSTRIRYRYSSTD
jgi:hypothetical protein